MSDINKQASRGRGRPRANNKKTEENKEPTQPQTGEQKNTGEAKPDNEAVTRGRPQTNNVEAQKGRVESERNTRKVPRVSMARTKKLDAEPRPGFYRYWFSQRRVAQAQAAYYNHVVDAEGNKVTRPAGNGEERLYLMEIEERFHQEDVEESKRRIHNNLKENVQNLSKDEYIPEGNSNPLSNQ